MTVLENVKLFLYSDAEMLNLFVEKFIETFVDYDHADHFDYDQAEISWGQQQAVVPWRVLTRTKQVCRHLLVDWLDYSYLMLAMELQGLAWLYPIRVSWLDDVVSISKSPPACPCGLAVLIVVTLVVHCFH